jgi:IS605 OrfB family transposase
LNTTKEQSEALYDTLLAANKAANAISDYAWENQTFRHYDLHKPLYQQLRKDFGLSAQVTVRILAKVSDAYKVDKKTKRFFKDTGSIAFDARILSWKLDKKLVSIWTVAGRMSIPFQAGKKQIEMLKSLRGEADLVLSKGIFYLLQVCEIPESPEFEPKGFLGVDFGIVEIAYMSGGKSFSGSELKGKRRRNSKLRRKLQKKGTKSAHRLLKKRSRKESRFAKDVNHRISKEIVSEAKRTNQAVVLEDLTGIRERIRVRKAQRYLQHSWPFFQLKSFVLYKAKREGIPVIEVDPRYSSRECSQCHYIHKRNRPNQSAFSCIECGFETNADYNASLVLSHRGRLAVNRAYAA